MSDVNTTIFNMLTAHAGLLALIGSRVYRLKAPDDPSVPFIQFQRLNTSRPSTIDGQWGVVRALYIFNIYTDTHAACESIKAQLLDALQAKRGSFSGIDIQSILSDDEGDTVDDENGYYNAAMTFYITYKEL